MFFRKKSPDTNAADGVAKKSIKNMDAVVTWVILGGIVASLYGVKKLKEKKDHHEVEHMVEPPKPIERKSLWKRLFSK